MNARSVALAVIGFAALGLVAITPPDGHAIPPRNENPITPVIRAAVNQIDKSHTARKNNEQRQRAFHLHRAANQLWTAADMTAGWNITKYRSPRASFHFDRAATKLMRASRKVELGQYRKGKRAEKQSHRQLKRAIKFL